MEQNDPDRLYGNTRVGWWRAHCVGYLSWQRKARKVEHILGSPEDAPGHGTLESRINALLAFYRWQAVVYDVSVTSRLLRVVPRRAPARGLLSHLDSRTEPGPSSMIRIRTGKRPIAPSRR
ncbi:hypothetical protein [Kitasatospora aureofaciens]|uniref:hypothetical protein n=1 Tax=Kitasatospora aureofaciens TaxID=1894 RepID=UPI00380AEE9F